MPCYYPLDGYRSRTKNASGKRSIVFNPSQGFRDQPLKVPCGQCIGCRLERSRQWAIRCVHEASLHENNSFLTLTYNPQNLPEGGTLVVADFQNFMKRLRKSVGHKIRFFHCGEYGESTRRPHYHAIIFGHDFKDKQLHKTINENNLYTSNTLNKLWPLGHALIGDVTFESAAYVARYCTKKITGAKALEHYTDIDYSTGEIINERKPEYTTMSRRPGIGKAWLEKFRDDIFPDDFVVLAGKKLRPPNYYLNQYEVTNPEEHQKIKAKRKRAGELNKSENTWMRLRVREEIQNYKYNKLIRNLE